MTQESGNDIPPDALKEKRKKASQMGLLLGALTLVVGSLVCLAYLLTQEPWKFKQAGPGTALLQNPQDLNAIKPNP